MNGAFAEARRRRQRGSGAGGYGDAPCPCPSRRTSCSVRTAAELGLISPSAPPIGAIERWRSRPTLATHSQRRSHRWESHQPELACRPLLRFVLE